jgi:hypothetical protein
MAEWVDPKKFPQHLPVRSFKGCSRKIEVCQVGKECSLPTRDEKGNFLGMKKRVTDKTLYIIRNCVPGREKDCIFDGREIAESVLAEKCKGKKQKRPCKRPPTPPRKGKG